MTKSNQQFYDETITHLRKQKKRSVRGGDLYCAYRGNDDCKCAIGVHIPDDKYHSSMEGQDVIWVWHNFPLTREYLLDPSHNGFALMKDLQCLHDYCLETENFEIRAEHIAFCYHLEYTPPSTQKIASLLS